LVSTFFSDEAIHDILDLFTSLVQFADVYLQGVFLACAVFKVSDTFLDRIGSWSRLG